MLKKNDEKIGYVVAVGNDGEGIVKDEDFVIFVPFALQGEKIKYRVLKVSKKIAFGKLLVVLEPSINRQTPNCPVFGKCGGCQLQHVKYEEQLNIKREGIKNAFKKVAFLEVEPKEVVVGDSPFRYRNKISLPVSQQGDNVLVGFYAENSHRVVDILDCPINPTWTSTMIKCLKEYMLEQSIKGYDEFTKKGDIREITVREVNGKLIITIVALRKQLRNINSFINLLKVQLVNEFSLYVNVNDNSTNKIYGDNFYLIYGDGEYQGNMLGIEFPMGVQSFMQVNNDVCQKLYSKVIELVDAKEDMVVLDAYSGAGVMTAMLAKNAKKVIGIEIIKEAVDLADDLKEKNGLSKKITNYNGKCEEILPRIIEQERQKHKEITVVLDPPRKGCDISVIDALIKSDIDKIVYVSCKPTSLARDVGLLIGTLKIENGNIIKADNNANRYSVQTVIPFDMFPNTKHVETIVCLTKNA